MTLVDHLDELRARLIRVVIIVFLSFFVCYEYGPEITELLLKPLRDAMGTEGKIVYLGLLDKILTQFQLSFWSAIIFSSPLWFYQIWLFIRPGLYDREVKVIRPFILVGFLLFCAGIAFGYFIVFPYTFKAFMSFGVSGIEANLSLSDYIVLAVKILLFLGILFQLPNILLILGFMGVVTKELMFKSRRYAIVASAVVSAIITPTPDVFTMSAVWIPMMLLYEIGIWAVVLIATPYQRRQNLPTETVG